MVVGEAQKITRGRQPVIQTVVPALELFGKTPNTSVTAGVWFRRITKARQSAREPAPVQQYQQNRNPPTAGF